MPIPQPVKSECGPIAPPFPIRLRLQAFKGLPVIIGGIEASLRRLVHYDFWDRIRGSIILDAKADLLVYGMGEHQVVEIARRLEAGLSIKECRDIPGVLYALGGKRRATRGRFDAAVARGLPQ